LAVSQVIEGLLPVAEYERFAQEYYRSLPMEHFMEAIPQATQRKITLESLDLLHARRPEVQIFSELLVLYQLEGRLVPVVPDNMVLVSDKPVQAKGSFNLEHERARPFWVLEWVSPNTEGKDYVDSFRRYEQELRVPYCLLYYPEEQDLRLYRHTGTQYALVEPNAQGRLAIPELDLELALLDGWVRYWYRGELLPLPADLQERVEELEVQIGAERERTEFVRREAAREKQRAEAERERAELERQRAEAEEQRAEAERQRADHEAQARQAAEAELARLRALLAKSQKPRQLPPG
jgi:Uma2 family endonuclease